MFLDMGWDTLVRMFLGWIPFMKLFAWIAIWAFKLPTFPVIIFGWAWTILTETMVFPVSGWMIFFGGSGCYLRWGHNCHFPNGKRFKDRSYWEIADLAWLIKNPAAALDLPPSYNNFNQSLMKEQGQRRRKMVADASPMYLAQDLITNIAEYIAM